MANVSSDDECLPPPKKKVALPKKTNTQKFRTAWLSDSAFKAWLVALRPGSSDASSKFCQKMCLVQKLAMQTWNGGSKLWKKALIFYQIKPQQHFGKTGLKLKCLTADTSIQS